MYKLEIKIALLGPVFSVFEYGSAPLVKVVKGLSSVQPASVRVAERKINTEDLFYGIKAETKHLGI